MASVPDTAPIQDDLVPILHVDFIDLHRFYVLDGDLTAAYDVNERMVYAEPYIPDETVPYVEFKLIGVCRHCDEMHDPGFAWDGEQLYWTDKGGLEIDGVPRWPDGTWDSTEED